jgi:plasmid stabilization system protein ParE
MRVHWTNRAKARLRLIYNYIAEDSPKMALQVVDRVTTRSQQLRDIPRSGRQVPEYNRPDYASYWKDPTASFTK